VQETANLFIMIGADPNMEWLVGTIDRDANGFIKTGTQAWLVSGRHACSPIGVFAVGDVRSGSIKRVASAVGGGADVISEVHEFLQRMLQG
jgi:thioredoxin reductase (NADPH)